LNIKSNKNKHLLIIKDMRKQWLIGLIALASTFGITSKVQAQSTVNRNHVPSKERVDDLERRRDVVDGNQIRATITNYLQTAQSGNGSADYFYEYPKNTKRQYVALTQMWVGAQTLDKDGKDIYLVDVADFRPNLNGQTKAWNFRPIKGYVNPAGSSFGIAQSDEPTSWPPTWPDKKTDSKDPGWAGAWNGYFGKNVFNADQEFFYKDGDDQYDRFPTYFPDDTDKTRKGLGVVVDARVMAWTQVLIDNTVFLLHGIKNDGSKDLNKVAVSMWLADLVGGDSQDDIPFFDISNDVAFMTDADGRGTEAFGSDKVGVASISFLETPGNSTNRIDDDGDGSTVDCKSAVGECSSPVVTADMLIGEDPTNGIDDNGNGLIDESKVHIPSAGDATVTNAGVGYADHVDNDGDGEDGSPVVTAQMVALANTDKWKRWPVNPEGDAMQKDSKGKIIVNLVGLDESDIGKAFKDNIDNDNSAGDPTGKVRYTSERYQYEPGSPLVTQAMITQAASDPYHRLKVAGTDIILYDLGAEDLNKPYADGKDNDGDGAIDEGIDEQIDEMIDESRSDSIDNDGDWDSLRDDTGLDGVGFTGDVGDGDKLPTSGAGTAFPGEKNIDITDVSESDQIGITNVQIVPAFNINFSTNSDQYLFNRFMTPGDLVNTKPPAGENDLVVSSSTFPLQAGQTERISLAVGVSADIAAALRSRNNALQAYSQDYQFAQAPVAPTLRAVPGDKKITLYWDSAAESSFDQFLAGLGLPAYDFEGYRIYRATDPSFLDSQVITDGFGNKVFKKPIAQFDLIDGKSGFHPVDVNGIKFYMGTDKRDAGEGSNGLAHSFVDTDVQNGISYYYAITAYDFGAISANISPTETPIRIRRTLDGQVEVARNVIKISPATSVSGYQAADVKDLTRTKGLTSSTMGYQILDPTVLPDNHRFKVAFRDTLIASGSVSFPDTLTTKDFTLTDLTTNKVLLKNSKGGFKGREFPVVDDAGNPLGFQLLFINEPFVTLNAAETKWKDATVFPITFDPYSGNAGITGLRNPADYRVKIVADGAGKSVALQVRSNVTLPARPTNVQIFRLEPDATGVVKEVPVDYAFWDLTGTNANPNATTNASFSTDPTLGESDFIIFYEPKVGDTTGKKVITWRLGLNYTFKSNQNPKAGDVIDIIVRKPFLSSDEFQFTTNASTIDNEKAKASLDKVIVVPNPYVVTNRFEPLNPYQTGRGPRALKFMNLPAQCTIRIYTVGGQLVKTLERNTGSNTISTSSMLDGTLEWDLLTEDALSVAYGVYLYVVEAPNIGQTKGTFAIIK
jgi:hypothetical protein